MVAGKQVMSDWFVLILIMSSPFGGLDYSKLWS